MVVAIVIAVVFGVLGIGVAVVVVMNHRRLNEVATDVRAVRYDVARLRARAEEAEDPEPPANARSRLRLVPPAGAVAAGITTGAAWLRDTARFHPIGTAGVAAAVVLGITAFILHPDLPPGTDGEAGRPAPDTPALELPPPPDLEHPDVGPTPTEPSEQTPERTPEASPSPAAPTPEATNPPPFQPVGRTPTEDPSQPTPAETTPEPRTEPEPSPNQPPATAPPEQEPTPREPEPTELPETTRPPDDEVDDDRGDEPGNGPPDRRGLVCVAATVPPLVDLDLCVP